MRRRAYIKVPAPPTQTPRARIPLRDTSMRNLPRTQTRMVRRGPRVPRGTIRGVGGALIGYGLRRLYNRMKRRQYQVEKVKPTGAGSTNSYYREIQRFHPGLRIARRSNPAQYYHFNESQRLNGAFGKQIYSHRDMGSIFDLRAMIIQIPNYNNTTQAFLHSIVTETTFTNVNEATCYLDLYEVVPRYSFTTAYEPGTSWNNGLIDAGLTSGAQTLHTVPTMSTNFASLWNIKKKIRIELAQGQSHRHTATYLLGYKWSEQLYATMGANTYFPKTSRALLYVAYGAPVNSEDRTQVTTSTTNLDIVQKSRFVFYYNQPTRSHYTFVDSLPALSTAYTLDIGSGERDEVGSA